MISLGQYEYNGADVLGSGAFAIVYKGHFKENPEKKVAIKRMLKDNNIIKSKTLLSKEIAVLKDLVHENIVRLYDYSISSQGVYLVMEYCNGGDLSDYLHRLKTLSEDTIQHFLIQLGSSMDMLSSKGIMHRDLKPGNILLCYPTRGRYASKNFADIPGNQIVFKLADFGFARFLQDGMMAVTMCGSPMYMAPEVLMCWKYDALADIWSLGIIVYQCLTGKAPFYANTPEALKNIYAKTPTLRPKIPTSTSPLLKDLLLRMLVRNPRDRIDFTTFLSHAFLKRKEEPPSPQEINPMKRRNSSGADIRVISNSPQTTNHYLPSTAPGSTPRFNEMLQDFGSPAGSSAPIGRAPVFTNHQPALEEEPGHDYVIVNSDGSEATTLPTAPDPARKLFDLSSGSTEISANILETCNTSPDYRRHLANLAHPAEVPHHAKYSPTRVRPPSYPALPKEVTPYQIVLQHSNSGDIPRSSPICSPPNATRFYVGSHPRTRGSSYSSSPASPHSPAPGVAIQASRGGSTSRLRYRTSSTASTGHPLQDTDINPELLMHPPELSEEVMMEPEHNDEVKRLIMVLELCELLTELAEQRSTPLSDCMIGGDTNTEDNTEGQPPVQPTAPIKFASEAQRIVEQVVLYKRVLQYLEFYFFQVKSAFQDGKLKPTRTARSRLKDCNSIYHRCYIRLRHLARDAQRDDLTHEVGHLRRFVTAEKLIFQYALDQCSAAEMDDFVGESEMCLRRYKAAMTLLHGLSQHARTDPDKERLSHYLGLVQDRYARLWNTTVPTADSPQGSP